MVIRKSGDLGWKNGSSVEEDGQGELQAAGEREGRRSRVHSARDWSLLPFGDEETVSGAGQQNE